MRKARQKPPPRQQRPRPRTRRRASPAFKVSSRALIISFAAAAALMLLAAVVPVLIPTSAYQRLVEERILRHADARVSIEKFRFQLLPYPGYTIIGMDLSSKSPPFQGLRFLRVEKMRGSLSFIGLVGGKIVTQVTADGVTFDYRSSEGASNLGALLGLAEGKTMVPSAVESTMAGESDISKAFPKAPAPADTPLAEPGEIRAIPMPQGVPGEGGAPPPAPTEELPLDERKRPGPTTETPNLQPEPGVQETLRPSTELIRDFVLRSASAEELSPDGNPKKVIISSISVSNGRINLWKGGAIELAIDGIGLSAGNLSLSGGLGADIRMSGRILGRAGPLQEAAGGYESMPGVSSPAAMEVGLAGQLFVDGSRREFGARNLKLSIGGSQMSADFSVDYASRPPGLNINLATPDLNPRSASPILDLMGFRFPSGLSWNGPVSAGLSLKGTAEMLDISAWLDGAPARFSYADIFAKNPGLPLKLSFSMLLTPESMLLSEGELKLGQEEFVVKGDMGREEDRPVRLSLSGTGLDLGGLKLFFPKIGFIDAIDSFDLTLDAEGSMSSELPIGVRGSMKGKRLSIAGAEIADFEGSFERMGATSVQKAAPAGETAAASEVSPMPLPAAGPGGGVLVPSLRGLYAGGELSGNGMIAFSPATNLVFDAIVSGVDATAIPLLGGAVLGEAALVVKLSSSGEDTASLEKNAKFSGSLLMSEGSLKEMRTNAQLFTAELWKSIEEASGLKLDAAEEEKLMLAENPIRDAKVSFEADAGKILMSEISWSQGSISIKASGEATSGDIRGEGEATLGKDAAQKLVTSPPARKVILDGEEKLVLPIKIAGKVSQPELHVDTVKLGAALRERAQVAAAAKPEKPKPEAKPASSRAPAAKSGAAEAKAPKKPAPASGPVISVEPKPTKPSAPPTEEQVDDILKVIIGH